MAKPEYIQRNLDWLAEKSRETGVYPLGNGIYYKAIKSGNSKSSSPDRGSVVTVHYTGRTINGHVFDSSRGGVAPAFRLRDLIPGWIIALSHMHPGDPGSCIFLRLRPTAVSASLAYPEARR